MLRSFEDFVNRPANDKMVYGQEIKMTRNDKNSHVRLALYFHLDRFGAFGCHSKFICYLTVTHPPIPWYFYWTKDQKDLGRPNHRGVSLFDAPFWTGVWVLLICPSFILTGLWSSQDWTRSWSKLIRTNLNKTIFKYIESPCPRILPFHLVVLLLPLLQKVKLCTVSLLSSETIEREKERKIPALKMAPTESNKAHQLRGMASTLSMRTTISPGQ